MNFKTQEQTMHWYAIHVKSNHERIAAQSLRGKGFEPFLPVYSGIPNYSGGLQGKGRRTAEVPLFAGYLFCRFDARKRLPILTTPGVVRIVGSGKVPVAMDPEEMDNILALTQSHLPVTTYPYPPLGETIRLERGPLSGVEGVIIAHKGKDQLVVSATLLQRSIAIDVERSWITPVCSTSSAQL